MNFTGLITGLLLLLTLDGLALPNLAQNGPVHPASSLETLPTGQYYYEAVGQKEQGSVLLRKIGHTVVGIDRRSRSQSPCFRGFLAGDRITSATRIFPPYQPDSRWETERGEMIDLSRYQRVDRTPTDEEAAALHTCLVFFSR